MSKKIIFFIIILILIIFSIVSFSDFKKNSNDKNRNLTKLTVLLDWFPNTNHTGLYVAKEKGYFNDMGLDVEIIQPADADNLQILAANKADFAVSSQESITLARAKDIPVVSLAAIIQHNTSAFASLEKSNIKSVKDFEGKRYGGWGSPIEEATLKALTNKFNTDYSKIKNITIGTTDFFTTIGKESDFQWIFYGWDGIEAKRRGIKLNTIMLKDLLPVLDYYTPVVATNENILKNKKDLVRKFMTSVIKGYEFAIKNPGESSEILIKNAPELNNDLVRESQNYLSPLYQAESPKWGIEKESVWQSYADWLFAQKLIDKNIVAKDAFTNDFLE